MAQLPKESRWTKWFGHPLNNAAMPIAASVGISTTGTATKGMEALFTQMDSPTWLIGAMAGSTAVTYYLMNTFLYGSSVVAKAHPAAPETIAPTAATSQPQLTDKAILEAYHLGYRHHALIDSASTFHRKRLETQLTKNLYDALCDRLRAQCSFSFEDCYFLRLDIEVERLRSGDTKAFNMQLEKYLQRPEHLSTDKWRKLANAAKSRAGNNLRAIRKVATERAIQEINYLKLRLSYDDKDQFIQNRLDEVNNLVQPLKASDWKELREFQIPNANANAFIECRKSIRERKEMYNLLFRKLEVVLHESYQGYVPRKLKGLRKSVYDKLSALLFALENARLNDFSADVHEKAFVLETFLSRLTDTTIAEGTLSLDGFVTLLNQMSFDPTQLQTHLTIALQNQNGYIAKIKTNTLKRAQQEFSDYRIQKEDRAKYIEYRQREQEKMSRNNVLGFRERLARTIAKPIGLTGAAANGAMTYGGLGKVLAGFGFTPYGVLALTGYFVLTSIISSLAFTYGKTISALGKIGRLFEKGKHVGTKEKKRPTSVIIMTGLTIGVGGVSGVIAYLGTMALIGIPVVGWVFAIATFIGASSIYAQNGWKRLGQIKSKLRIARLAAREARQQHHNPVKAYFKSLFDLGGNGPWQKIAKGSAGILGMAMLGIASVMAASSLIGLLGFAGGFIIPVVLGTACVTTMLSAILIPNLYELFSKAGHWLDEHRIGPFEALGLALDKVTKTAIPFAAAMGVVSLVSLVIPVTWPAWAAAAVVIPTLVATMAIVSTLILPPLRKVLDKFAVKTGLYPCLRFVFRGIDKAFKSIFHSKKESPKAGPSIQRSESQQPLIIKSRVAITDAHQYTHLFQTITIPEKNQVVDPNIVRPVSPFSTISS